MAGRGWPGGRGAGGGARRGRGWAGPLGSVMLTSRPAEMGTKGDGATITHETGASVRGREEEGEGERGGEGEREGEGEGEIYLFSFTAFSFSF